MTTTTAAQLARALADTFYDQDSHVDDADLTETTLAGTYDLTRVAEQLLAAGWSAPASASSDEPKKPRVASGVTLDWNERKLLVDGTEFPWLIAEEPGPSIQVDTDDFTSISRVTVTFFADGDVEIIKSNRGGE
ncbi:hypothetical protein DW322_00825 [Rhodococcus rhodnii]|uniref:Halobacterial output domain-containing protein n=2 Tax=Rhodococcus rhodnii TaxID=38312 RepID=R7WKD0_9NOCA|nr:hypothetical protein [Rhodococcus rhodnii]EOM75763.1 hypothetical protein Rrhod_2905 [Rhodococcus rhodnii LMG 5362]TXG88260.1 hypothetical protein DW322_21495 [Rhodococcus rhodnii]TXG89048.1 hypothetical protein DW322_00825 [Rhodococcus rhodnii]